MAQMKLAGDTYEVDENGFMQETDRWTEDVARAYAAREDVNELTDEHWTAVNYLRNYYLENGICPMIRRLIKETGFNLSKLYELFPRDRRNPPASGPGCPNRPDASKLRQCYSKLSRAICWRQAMNPYSYDKDKSQPNLQLKQTTRHWSHYLVDFPTAHPTPYEKSNTVLGEYFQPRGADNAPLVVLLHGIGDLSVPPCKMLAKTLARKGIASFVLYSVMHSKRMPASVLKRFPHPHLPGMVRKPPDFGD